jgi:hypothetical protein
MSVMSASTGDVDTAKPKKLILGHSVVSGWSDDVSGPEGNRPGG